MADQDDEKKVSARKGSSSGGGGRSGSSGGRSGSSGGPNLPLIYPNPKSPNPQMPDDAPTLYSSCGFLGFGKKVAPPPQDLLKDILLLTAKSNLCEVSNDLPWCAEMPPVDEIKSLLNKQRDEIYELGREFIEPNCKNLNLSGCFAPCKFEGERCVSNYSKKEVLYSSCGFLGLGFNKKEYDPPMNAFQEWGLQTTKIQLTNHIDRNTMNELDRKREMERQEIVSPIYDPFCRLYDTNSCGRYCKVEGGTCVFDPTSLKNKTQPV